MRTAFYPSGSFTKLASLRVARTSYCSFSMQWILIYSRLCVLAFDPSDSFTKLASLWVSRTSYCRLSRRWIHMTLEIPQTPMMNFRYLLFQDHRRHRHHSVSH